MKIVTTCAIVLGVGLSPGGAAGQGRVSVKGSPVASVSGGVPGAAPVLAGPAQGLTPMIPSALSLSLNPSFMPSDVPTALPQAPMTAVPSKKAAHVAPPATVPITPLPERLRSDGARAADVIASLAEPNAQAGDARAAGESLEALLTSAPRTPRADDGVFAPHAAPGALSAYTRLSAASTSRRRISKPAPRVASRPARARAKIAGPVAALAASYVAVLTTVGSVALIGTVSASAMVSGLLFIAGGLAIISLYPVMLAPLEEYPALGIVLVPAAFSLLFAPLLLTGAVGALSSAIAPLAATSDLALLGAVAAGVSFFGFFGSRVLDALKLAPASMVNIGVLVLGLGLSAGVGLGANLLLGFLPSTHLLAALAAAVHGGFFPSVLAGLAAIFAAATPAGALATAAAGGLGALVGSVDRADGWRLDFGGAARGLAIGAAIGLGLFAWLSAGVTAGLILAGGVAAVFGLAVGAKLALRRLDARRK